MDSPDITVGWFYIGEEELQNYRTDYKFCKNVWVVSEYSIKQVLMRSRS